MLQHEEIGTGEDRNATVPLCWPFSNMCCVPEMGQESRSQSRPNFPHPVVTESLFIHLLIHSFTDSSSLALQFLSGRQST